MWPDILKGLLNFDLTSYLHVISNTNQESCPKSTIYFYKQSTLYNIISTPKRETLLVHLWCIKNDNQSKHKILAGALTLCWNGWLWSTCNRTSLPFQHLKLKIWFWVRSLLFHCHFDQLPTNPFPGYGCWVSRSFLFPWLGFCSIW